MHLPCDFIEHYEKGEENVLNEFAIMLVGLAFECP